MNAAPQVKTVAEDNPVLGDGAQSEGLTAVAAPDKQFDKQGTFTYEWIEDTNSDGGHYRIADPKDNAVGFCYSEHNAVLLTDALNAVHSARGEADARHALKDLIWACLLSAEGDFYKCSACGKTGPLHTMWGDLTGHAELCAVAVALKKSQYVGEKK